MFVHTDSIGRVDLAFTDRRGGVSTGAWESLNLGTSNGDDPDAVATNLERVATAIDVTADQMVRVSQFHGRDVHVVGADDPVPAGSVARADALVTARPGVALLVRVADCVPVVLADDVAGVVGVAHAGREGMAAGVVGAAVGRMRDLGAHDVRAWVGPRACGRCYEVPAQMRADVAAAVPRAWSTTSWGTPALDLAAGVLGQLAGLGVEAYDLAADRPACTIEDADDYFSYRRQGQLSGRLGAIVRMRP